MRFEAPQRVRLALVLLVLAGSAWGAGPATAEPATVGELAQGEHVFWKGPYTQREAVPAADLCDVAGPCWTHRLDVAEAPRGRLRVAVDWPSDTNSFGLELHDPFGRLAASGSGSGRWSVELFVPDPTPGAWTVRVIPEDVTASAFRARAKLDPAPSPPAEPTKLLPNLQALPPWDSASWPRSTASSGGRSTCSGSTRSPAPSRRRSSTARSAASDSASGR